jgi:hypothetical protein
MLRYLLDTNIVIYVLNRRPVEVDFTHFSNHIALPAPRARLDQKRPFTTVRQPNPDRTLRRSALGSALHLG